MFLRRLRVGIGLLEGKTRVARALGGKGGGEEQRGEGGWNDASWLPCSHHLQLSHTWNGYGYGRHATGMGLTPHGEVGSPTPRQRRLRAPRLQCLGHLGTRPFPANFHLIFVRALCERVAAVASAGRSEPQCIKALGVYRALQCMSATTHCIPPRALGPEAPKAPQGLRGPGGRARRGPTVPSSE